MSNLKAGASYFNLVGNVKISDKVFEQKKRARSGYIYSMANIPVSLDDGGWITVQLMGGYNPNNPVLYKYDGTQMIEVAWEERKTPAILETLAPSSFINARLERDADGSLIKKSFLSELDAIEYIANHLKNEDKVFISGVVEYNYYQGNVRRVYKIHNIALASDESAYRATLRQTFLLDNNSLAGDFDKKLKADNQYVVKGYVPQYINKYNDKVIKSVKALKQEFVLRPEEDKVESCIKIAKRLLSVPKGTVRAIDLDLKINDGFQASDESLVLTDEVKELIELGLTTEEDIKKETTVNGSFHAELEFVKPALFKQDGKVVMHVSDDYTTDVLEPIEDEEVVDAEEMLENDDLVEVDGLDDDFDLPF